MNTTLPPVTDWFPGHIKPALPGVYERDSPGFIKSFSHWNGSDWSESWGTPEQVREHLRGGWQGLPWRGLASDPTKPAKPKPAPREWMRWAVMVDGDLTAFTYPTRRWARSAARGSQTPASVIRVRVTEV